MKVSFTYRLSENCTLTIELSKVGEKAHNISIQATKNDKTACILKNYHCKLSKPTVVMNIEGMNICILEKNAESSKSIMQIEFNENLEYVDLCYGNTKTIQCFEF